MSGRERMALAIHNEAQKAAVKSTVAIDERDVRAAREEAFESGFMTGLGVAIGIAIVLGAMFFFLSRLQHNPPPGSDVPHVARSL